MLRIEIDNCFAQPPARDAVIEPSREVTMKSSFRAAAVAAACLVTATMLASGEGQNAATPRIALTFDDLPAHGPLPPGVTRPDIARSILAALKAHNAPPTYGFVNARQLETTPADIEVLQMWRAAGHPLGNHAFSHMDLHANTAAAFEQDVLANEATLRTLMGDRDWRWFRYPYLREGDTPDKYNSVREALAKHGYRVAQVTMDFNDYAYNGPYARCLAKNDQESIAWLKQSYMERAAASITRGQDAARAIFGRDISHVMLLHIGGFETVMFPRLLELLRDRGFTLTTLEEAQSDDAYKTVPVRDGNWSGTLLNQLQPRPAAPAQQEVKPPATDDVFARLPALCM
jgi:peptidoglycan-N-acetylglucosamine deacetylase